MADINRQIVIDHIPEGKLGAANFRLREAPVPTPGEGELLPRTRYISFDAANRAWMLRPTYRSALSAGQLMAGGALAEVTQSRAPGFAPGDLVFADTGWQEYAVLPARHLLQGFLVMDFNDQREKALTDLKSWVLSGQMGV